MIKKLKFNLHTFNGVVESGNGDIEIVQGEGKEGTYVAINIPGNQFHFISGKDKDLECFAVNILKALKSKRLKP